MNIEINGNGGELVIGKLTQDQTLKIFPLLSEKKEGNG